MIISVKSAGVILCILLFSAGCESAHNSRVGNGLSVTGKIGEILVVCEQGIWNSEIKNHLDTGLTQWILPYLPDVATFILVHKTPSHFTQGVKRYRNTLFIDIDPDYSGEYGRIVKREDVWAKGQLVIEVTGKDFNQVLETCKLGMEEVHDLFDEIEWKRLIQKFSRNKNQGVRDVIKANFGIDLALPSNSKLVSQRKNFYRVEFPPASRPIEFVGTGTQDVGAIFSGILIYQYDYKDSSQFEMKQLLQARDTMLKYNVPHEIEGMYMGTQYNPVVYPEGNIMQSADGKIEGYEMRGMFLFTGLPKHSTGGAFWAFHFLNNKTQKLVCISGYVDAPPTTSWTHPLREIQAILRSVSYVQ
jgi:hypothetical protein